jgi:hypothetical protein
MPVQGRMEGAVENARDFTRAVHERLVAVPA